MYDAHTSPSACTPACVHARAIVCVSAHAWALLAWRAAATLLQWRWRTLPRSTTSAP
eukprot:COSAG01_NODE_2131_length_8361_cov_7.018276_2_plen_57_part_00